ncbi:MAG: CBS domain-containing protein [Terriglobales bacterium]
MDKNDMSGLSTSAFLPLVGMQATIRATMATIDRFAKGIAMVVDDQQRLLATVTDGDIRRAILAGISLESTVQALKQVHPTHEQTAPVTASLDTPEAELIALMNVHSIRQVPLMDAEGRVAGLAVLNDLLRESALPLTGVIMAGGFGNRLRPLTDSLPKPMLPVNGRHLLGLIFARCSIFITSTALILPWEYASTT